LPDEIVATSVDKVHQYLAHYGHQLRSAISMRPAKITSDYLLQQPGIEIGSMTYVKLGSGQFEVDRGTN
jgi:hypothetical protein